MQTIEIDGVEYDLNNLPDNAKDQLASMQLTDQLIVQAQQKLAILQTARNAYAVALRDILDSE